jgi:urease accessory protein
MAATAITRTVTADGGITRSTRIEVALAGERARITTLANGEFIAARPQQIAGNYARVALVGINMALLAGDVVDLRVRVGVGAVLEIIEPTGLVAYNAEGRRSTWGLRAAVGAGATLIWRGAPFIAALGSNAHRFTEVMLEPDAHALLKETLVLGRSAESGVCLRSRTDVSRDGQALLVEELLLDEETGVLPGIVAPSRVVGTVTAAGWRPQGDEASPHRLELAGPGALFRALAPAAHCAEDLMEPLFQDWRGQALRREAPTG